MRRGTKRAFAVASGRLAGLVLLVLVLGSCSLDNGMPRDLAAHLRSHGISLHATRASAPISQRGGYVVAKYDAPTVQRIVERLRLERLAPDDPQWLLVSRSAAGSLEVKELWGASGRPAAFRLKDGGQFEYVYLLVTPGGEMWLFAEYAYG